MTELEKLEKELLQEIQEEPGIYENAEEFCTIDPETRTITVPLSKRILGTESDQETNRLYFKCPKVVGDNVDLSLFSLRVNYQNAGNKKDQYLVEDVKEEGDTITFSWLLKRSVTAYKGNVKFILCAVKTAEDGAIKNEWNTTLNTECESLEGMEVDQTAVEEETKDIVEQLIAMMNQSAENAVHALEEAKAEVDKEVEDFTLKAQQALADVNNAGQEQTERVQTAGNDAVESIKAAQGTAARAVETAKTEAIKAVQTEGTTQAGNVSTEGEKQVQAVRGAAQEIIADREQIQMNKEGVAKLKEDLDDLRIESKNMFFVEQGEIVNGIITVNAEKSGSVLNFKQNGQNTSNVYAVIKRLKLEAGKTYTFSATRKSGYYNDSGAISLAIYRTDNNALVGSFSFVKILNGSSNSFTFTPNYSSHYIQVTFASTGTIKEYDCDINFNLVEGAIADYSEYGYVNINKELPTIKYLLKHNIYDIVVAKDGSGDYTNLTEAVEKAKDFSTIYVKNGVYDNEIIKAWLKTVFIVGESRDGVIIKNNTGEYATPPIEMGTGMLKNLTVYAEGNATPTNKGYALHSESSVEASSCNFFILENCTFKSDYRQSWGMGMRGDTHYYARNCTFEEVYFHDCEHAYRATNQYIEFDSCNIIAKANGTALLLQDQQMSGANVNLMFNRCLVKSENGANIQYGKWTGSDVEWVSSLDDFPTWHLSTYSFGNSDNALND